MSEDRARFASVTAAGMGMLFVVTSLGFGFGGNSGLAFVFLLLTIVCLGATIYFVRIYTRVREDRFQQELRAKEQALNQLFDEAKDGGGSGGVAP